MTLFAVMLGGTAPGANTELHDVVFACGERLEDTWDQLLDLWFGAPEGLHVDSWTRLDAVDGHRIALRPAPPPPGGPRLWFVNLGAYRPGHFGELHAVAFLVGDAAEAVKARAKAALLRGTDSLHTDDLHEVDDCLEVLRAGGLHVHLEPAGGATAAPAVHNGWLPLPADAIAAWRARR